MTAPSPTVLGHDGHPRGGFEFVPIDHEARAGRPAPTVTGGGATTGGAEPFGRHGRAIIEKMFTDADKPAPVVAGDPRIAPRGCKHPQAGCCSEWPVGTERKPGSQFGSGTTRVSVAEAAALQSYPADFVWDATIVDPKTGRTKPITKTNQFLQVGNAVPPKLAEAILREVLS